MINITIENLHEQTATNRLICQNALNRGWRVRAPYIPCPHLYIDRGSGEELHIFSATGPDTSYAAAHLVNDKYATYVRLKDAKIPQLDTIMINDLERDQVRAVEFMERYSAVVVKPIDGGHGKGITTRISSRDQLINALRYAESGMRSLRGAIVQEQFGSYDIRDLRISVIAGKAVACVERIPARVFGDGFSTVSQLIAIENQRPDRQEAYRTKLAPIDTSRAALYLGDKLDLVLKQGEQMSVLGIANYGAGGETIDRTDDLPRWMVEESEQVANILELDVAGVDYMFSGPLSSHATREQLTAVITEVNKCPALSMHDEPTTGTSRHAVDAYLDYLQSL